MLEKVFPFATTKFCYEFSAKRKNKKSKEPSDDDTTFFHDPKKKVRASPEQQGVQCQTMFRMEEDDGEMREMEKVNLFDKQILKCRTQ